MFEMDFNDRKVGLDERGLSREDRIFLDKMDADVCLVGNHYQLPLPFKENSQVMPNNRSQALKRALWQKKKMQRDSKYHTDYTNFMNDIIRKGYARKISEKEAQPECGKLWYLPHHGIYHPKKPDKIRVVFDCSADYFGTSLNKILLQGPDLTNSLVGVLTRFRQEPVAFMADIEAMFHQVWVPSEHWNFLRFLWWPDGNLDLEIQEYQMVVHLFGAVSSPSVCNYALRKTADDNELDYPTVATVIRRNFYVDDCLRSDKTEESTTKLIDDLRTVCTKGGFHLTKFVSNSRNVLESIPAEERSQETRTLDLDRERLPIKRALGIQWCVESDMFEFRIILSDKPLTRRGILSTISSVYDPLGFVAPFILPAKGILQDLCRKDIDWDEDIPEAYRIQWMKWLTELPLLHKLQIPRCIKPTQFGTVVSRQIHIFSDASESGYGAVAYQRLVDDNETIHCAFLMGKARLAPIKAITIPRLELTAAVVSVRIGELLKKELDGRYEIIYHTDSLTVLRYIISEQHRFHVFVANRVQLIRDYSDPHQWRYIETAENPADDASRGIKGTEFLNQQRWFNGPKFLWTPEQEWPDQPIFLGPISYDDPEVKKEIESSATKTSEVVDHTSKLIHSISDWYRLKKSVAVFLRVKKILRTRRQSGLNSTDKDTQHERKFPLSAEELAKSEIAILKYVQHTEYHKEITYLQDVMTESGDIGCRKLQKKKKSDIKKISHIYRLDPYLDGEVLRVGGRLDRANLPQEIAHPIILPYKSHVTSLIIRHVHQQLGHAGRNHVIATLRENYWIVKINAAVRRVLSKCVFCRRYHGKPNEQKMSNLPEDRVTPAPPFTHTGVDYFGPFIIKEGRKELKKYGAIFTCLVSRAVHIEVANSLSSDSFIQALRRFISRRGPVTKIRSDNGSNFVGANKELIRAMKEMNHNQIQIKLRREGIEWLFNTPTASHMGGVWERQIKSIRKILAGLLYEHGSRLDEESFRTLLCEVEAVINSRPLTMISSDPTDLHPLTPNHILTTKSSIILPPPGNFQRNDIYLHRRWRRVQYLVNLFWTRWKREYLLTLQARSKWQQPKRNLTPGDIVILKEENTPRNVWPLGLVVDTQPDSKGFVRTVIVRTKDAEYRRPITKIVLLLAKEEQ
ncbi:uncharacterized protein LOC114530710 [Dendronephthya gigantea]|uniref:uncharacterized protein LOC114530710 n=1 Tax=Dendronephthya gigantea TaxID=151771 RepID=UPI00106AB14D|nr:uncharacterized protein LOC114530710 [Dendronephthya gigantea]